MSTSLAIIELVEGITNSLNNHESTVGVFIELKKAFDTVDHGILTKFMGVHMDCKLDWNEHCKKQNCKKMYP